jgi:hypothetical protein
MRTFRGALVSGLGPLALAGALRVAPAKVPRAVVPLRVRSGTLAHPEARGEGKVFHGGAGSSLEPLRVVEAFPSGKE